MSAVILPLLEMNKTRQITLPRPMFEFLTRRRLLVATYLSSLAYYFVRKAERAACATHPVVAQIVKIRKIIESSRGVSEVALLRAKEMLSGQGVFAHVEDEEEENESADTDDGQAEPLRESKKPAASKKAKKDHEKKSDAGKQVKKL
jgi:hypothetical protein